MRYGVEHVKHDQGGDSRVNAPAAVTRCGKKIERQGGNPAARDDLKLSRHEHTALRSLVRKGLRA